MYRQREGTEQHIVISTSVMQWSDQCHLGCFMHLFILFLAVLCLRLCGGFSLVAASRGYSLVALLRLLTAVASLVLEHGLQSVQASAVTTHGLWSTGSVVVVLGLSCSLAYWIFPHQGSNPCLLHWQADFLPLRHQEVVKTPLVKYS